MDDQDGFGFGRNGLGDRPWIKAQRLIDFSKDRYGAREQDRFHIGHEGKRRKDDFVAGSNSAGRQRGAEGSRPAGADVHVAHPESRRKSLFELEAFPLPVPGSVESIAHQHARIEHLLEVPTLFFPDQFKTRHRKSSFRTGERLIALPPLAPL